MTAETLIAAALAFFAAGVVKGAMGVGQLTVAVALLGTVMSLRDAVPLLIVPALAANLLQVLGGGGLGALLRRFGAMIALGCLGIWAGTAILYRVDPLALGAVLGAVVVAWAAAGLAAVPLPAGFAALRAREAAVSPALGLISGVLTGATGSLHLLLVPWFQALGLERTEFIRATGLAFLAGALFWAAALVREGALDGRAALYSALALVPTFAGMVAGAWLGRRVPERAFRTAVFAALIVLGLNLIRKAVM